MLGPHSASPFSGFTLLPREPGASCSEEELRLPPGLVGGTKGRPQEAERDWAGDNHGLLNCQARAGRRKLRSREVTQLAPGHTARS